MIKDHSLYLHPLVDPDIYFAALTDDFHSLLSWNLSNFLVFRIENLPFNLSEAWSRTVLRTYPCLLTHLDDFLRYSIGLGKVLSWAHAGLALTFADIAVYLIFAVLGFEMNFLHRLSEIRSSGASDDLVCGSSVGS